MRSRCFVRALLLVVSAIGALRGQTVTVTAAPAAVNVTYQTGAALPAPQAVQVKASTGNPAFTTAITPPTALWLAVSPDLGTLNAVVSMYINPTGLGIGSYAANVTVTVAGVVPPLTIPVNLTVTAAQPTLVVSTTSLAFSAPPSPSASQIVTLATTGGSVPFNVAATAVPWMTVTPKSGVVLPGGPVSLTVAVDASALAPQLAAYVAKIVITAIGVPPSNKTQNVAVSLLVQSIGPTLTSLWPTSARLASPDTVVTIRGTGFSPLSIASLQGVATALKATYVSPTAIEATIPAPQLVAATTLNVLVTNPAPGGASGMLPFLVTNNPVIAAAVNSASYASTAVSPGVLMTLFGTSLGPITPAFMQDSDNDGFVDTSLGGVSVTVDGVAAPMVYASQNQVTLQVPYEATVGLAKALVLTNGALTANGTVDIALTAPGIFAINGSGAGQAAALNFNATTLQYTVNSSTNAAKIGDTVVLYMTGEGDFATAIFPRTGLLVTPALTPLPQVSPLPTVNIGGTAATVAYAGPFVGSMLGVLQINCVVPVGAQTGAAVPLIVTIGAASSQAGVTMAIK